MEIKAGFLIPNPDSENLAEVRMADLEKINPLVVGQNWPLVIVRPGEIGLE